MSEFCSDERRRANAYDELINDATECNDDNRLAKGAAQFADRRWRTGWDAPDIAQELGILAAHHNTVFNRTVIAEPETWAASIAAEAERRGGSKERTARLNGSGLQAAYDATWANGVAVERFKLIDDAALENLPAIVWLLQRILPRNGLFMLYGQPGSLKTFWALLLAFHVALGRALHGREAAQGCVVFVAAEGAAGLSLRVRALREALGLAAGERAGVYFVAEAVNLSDPNEVAAFVEQVRPLKPALVFFDTLARCCAGADENSATEMGAVIGAADYIRQRTGGSVGFAHHPTKTGLTERGSSALRGAVDALIQISREDDVVTLTAEKLKDAEPFEPLRFRARRVEFEDGESSLVLEPTDGTSAEPVGVPTTLREVPRHVRTILETLRDAFGDDGASASLLLRTTKVADRSFFRSLKDARGWGFVIKQGQRYQLSLAGQELLR